MYFGFKNMMIRYGNKTVLEDITTEFPKGSVVTIIGQNGCGKSSLLKTVSKAVTPKSGDILYEDKPLSSYRPKDLAKKIAYLPQVHNSPPDIDVRTLVSYGRYPYSRLGRGLTSDDAKVIDETLALTGLTHLQDRILSTLSGGERQRAWIAMTICQEPEILILDEPTTYLDISYQVEVLELVKHLNQKLGLTIIMVLHDLNLAARYSDYLYAIQGGQLHACGTPREVLTRTNLKHIFNIDANICEDEWNSCPYFIPLKVAL
ncbi:MAG: ABC transporter ATP-binding protein [Lachnospiraceae bacterium]|nr:ABC transporter ATP-binding protein [Lachnospiraceae bacterium]